MAENLHKVSSYRRQLNILHNHKKAMKKTYIEPQMKVCFYDTESILDGTGVTGDNGTDWGGVDETGEKDPDANSMSTWEEEDYNSSF